MLKCVQKSTLIDRRCQDSKSSGIDRVVQRPDRLIERRLSDKRKRKITEAKGLTMKRRRANSGIIWVNNVLVPRRDCRPMIFVGNPRLSRATLSSQRILFWLRNSLGER